MSEKRLSESEGEPLSDWISRHVGRADQDVKCLEEIRHRGRRIREPPVRERVGCEQIAELVVDVGEGDRGPRQEGEAKGEGEQSTGEGKSRPRRDERASPGLVQ
jgi:hypothetical protein